MSYGSVPKGTALYHKKRRNVRKWERLIGDYSIHLVLSQAERNWKRIAARSGILTRRRNLLVALQESFESEDPWEELRTEGLLRLRVQQEYEVQQVEVQRSSIGRRCCAFCGRGLLGALRDPVLRDVLWRITKRLGRLSWKAGATVAVVAWTADQAGYTKTEILSAICSVIWKSLQHVR